MMLGFVAAASAAAVRARTAATGRNMLVRSTTATPLAALPEPAAAPVAAGFENSRPFEAHEGGWRGAPLLQTEL